MERYSFYFCRRYRSNIHSFNIIKIFLTSYNRRKLLKLINFYYHQNKDCFRILEKVLDQMRDKNFELLKNIIDYKNFLSEYIHKCQDIENLGLIIKEYSILFP